MDKLKKILKEANITQSEIAKRLNIKSLSTINLKLNGKAIVTTTEAKLLRDLINEKTQNNYTIEELFG